MKAAIIGVAHMHVFSYLRCMKELDIDVTGVYDDDQVRKENFATEHGLNTFDSLEDLFQTDCDTVVICSENVHHLEHVTAAAKQQRHVIVEKPMAISTEEADQMIAVTNQHDVKLFVCHPVRFSPVMQELKSLVTSEQLGEVYAINASNHGKNPGGWFVDRALSGGGAIIDHTIHIADLVYWLFDKEIKSVSAQSATALHDIPVEDTGLLHVVFTDDTLLSLDTSWNRPDNYPVWGDAIMEIICENGRVLVDGFGRYADVYHNTGNQERVYYEPDMDIAMFTAFKDIIENDLPSPVAGDAGRFTIEMFELAYQSIATEKTAFK